MNYLPALLADSKRAADANLTFHCDTAPMLIQDLFAGCSAW
jgi:hypothetical protein